MSPATVSLPPSKALGEHTPRRLRRAAEIVAAAREVFLEKGFAAASVGEIATKVGVVPSLVFSYYPSKRHLLDEVLEQLYQPLIFEMSEGFAKLTGLRSRLRFLVWRHMRAFIEERGLARLVLHEVRLSSEYFASGLHALHIRYTSFLMTTIEQAIASGELPPDTDAEMFRSIVYGGIEHRLWSTLFGRSSVDVEDVADRFTDSVLGGFQPKLRQPVEPRVKIQAALDARIARIEQLALDQRADIAMLAEVARRKR